MPGFYQTRRLSQEMYESTFQPPQSLFNELDTANIMGKVKHLETEVSEVNQLVNREK